jgi:beta-glucosidase
VEQKKGLPVRVTLDVRNVGKTAGAEVIQLYVKDVKASIDRPAKELKAFAKIELLPDQIKQVQLLLNRDAFAFFSPMQNKWVVEPGEFELLVGSSSRDIRLTDTIIVE